MKLTSVGKRYGRGPWLFTDLTLDLEPGRVTAVSGSNGSGKSTLLDLVAGLSRPTAGTISGRPDRIGYVPEQFPAQQRLSAASYLTHMGRVRGLSTTAARSSGHALLERFSFTGGLDRALPTLSKGNAQKVALAQALLVAPDLLILDEPWTGLDEIGHDVLSEVVSETASAGGIVVLSRHLAVPGPVMESVRYDLDEAVAVDPADPAWNPTPAGAGTAVPTPTATAARTVRVLLNRRDGSRPLPQPWFGAGVPGPDTAVDHGDVVAFTVPDGEADRLLLAALQAGWSVFSVRSTVADNLGGNGPETGPTGHRAEPA